MTGGSLDCGLNGSSKARIFPLLFCWAQSEFNVTHVNVQFVNDYLQLNDNPEHKTKVIFG